MRSSKIVHIVSCHAEGEVGDVIVGGIAPPPGASVWEQSRWIAEDETLRNFVLNEPRGGVFRHVNLLVPAKDPRAQMAWIIMEPADTPPMSGSNSLCVSTVLLDSGILPMTEPQTRLVLEAPGGLIEAVAECKDGKVQRVEIRNVPSFADRLDAWIEVEGLGSIQIDTAYGGDSFAIVESQGTGRDRPEDHPRGQRAVGIHSSAEPGLVAHLLLSDRRTADLRKRGRQWRQRSGDPPRQDRPLTLRHRLLGAHGGVAGQGRAEGRRAFHRPLDHRLRVPLPYRFPDRGGRTPGDLSLPLRPGLDHRHPPVAARSRRSVAAGLSAVGHLARGLSQPTIHSITTALSAGTASDETHE